MAHLVTLAASAHLTLFYQFRGVSLATLTVFGGTTAIAATSTNIICTAVSIDASSSVLLKAVIPLRGIRFNPAPGSQE